MNYPTEITPEILKGQAHISNEEVRQDIADTEYEIENLTKERDGWELISQSTMEGLADRRMAQFHFDACEQGIKERSDFIKFLRLLLEARATKDNNGTTRSDSQIQLPK